MNYAARQIKINNYTQFSEAYRDYLIKQINKEIKAIKNEEFLNDLYLILEPSQFNIEKDLSVFKENLADYLREQYSSCFNIERLELTLTAVPSLLWALKKYYVIETGLNILQKAVKQNAITNFITHIQSNKSILVKPRLDYGLYALGKGSAVLLASLGLGIGGYIAYKELFVKTRGGEYLEKIASVENINSLRP